MGYIGQVPTAIPLTSADITDGTITNADINASAAIVQSKLASIVTADITTNQIDETLMKDAFVGDFSDVTITAADTILYGDATDSGNTKKDTVQGILDLAGGGATLVDEETTGSGTTVTLSGIPSSAKTVSILFDEVSTSGGDTVSIRLGDADGIETSGYISTLGLAQSTFASNSSGSHMPISAGGGGAYLISGIVHLRLMNSSSNRWAYGHTGKATTAIALTGGGVKSLTAPLSQVEVVTFSGAFDNGVVNLQYTE